MSSSTYTIALISLVLCLSALSVQASSCVHIVKDSSSLPRVFDLCSFTDPITLQYNVKPYLNATMTFSLNKPATPSCNQSTSVWGTIVNHDVNICADFQNQDPTYGYVSQRSAAPGIVITYPNLTIDAGNIELTLRCNQTAPANGGLNLFVDRWEGTTFYVTGYSYYGCPVKANAGSFLSF